MQAYDLLIVGGGINGAGIARDAAGRGLSVCLVEAGDPAGATSSASSKLIHGGLRYLEQYAFGLVRESLRERAVMLRIAPHLTRPCRFVLPLRDGLRPAWMMQMGLWLYDNLGGEDSLPDATRIRLDDGSDWAAPLQPGFKEGFLYFDVQVDDARLVILTLRDAETHGADILTGVRFLGASRQEGLWQCRLQQGASTRTVAARTVVNSAGPWVGEVLDSVCTVREQPHPAVRLVRGSHIVVPRCYAGDHAYTLQNDDGRVVFLLPFHDHWTLIGTTDVRADLPDLGDQASGNGPVASAEEIAYLCRAASRYLHRPVTEEQIAWSFAGLRPLYDDGKADPSAVTRDYHLVLDKGKSAEALLLSVFGGKLTTHRHLAETVMEKLAPYFPHLGESWTATAPLPGGDSDGKDFCAATAEFFQAYRHLPEAVTHGLWARHGTLAFELLANVRTVDDLGCDFGAGLTELEAMHFIRHEWAHRADDILWRRSKAGLAMSPAQRSLFDAWIARHAPEAAQALA
ncbi:MAG: glycerol-3-phosphate dehydrogenase [Rhodocyclaceae bacterium]|nr:glycerol-3-phosphate dehydrogenase [Rhodocyclaceae bacterium]